MQIKPKLITILLGLIWIVSSKIYETDFSPTQFRKNSNWVYLTKMGFGPGLSTIELETKVRGSPHFSPIFPLEVAIVSEADWLDQLSRKCATGRKDMVNKLQTNGQTTISTKTLNLTQETLFYFVAKDCENKLLREYTNDNLHIEIRLKMLNNEGHFGTEEDCWPMFPLIIFIALCLLMQNHTVRVPGQEIDWAKSILFGAIAANLSSLFWKSFNFILYWKYGHLYAVFDVFYLGMHAMSESIVIGLLMLIAFGWTINYIDFEEDIYAPMMAMVGMLNVIVTLFNKLYDSDHDKYHMYDSVPGTLVLGFRILILLGFIYGLVSTYRKALPKKRPFVVAFGICGFLFISALPLLVLFVELFVKASSQNEFLFISVEVVKTAANALLTYMINSNRSTYNQVGSFRNFSFLPDTQRAFF